MSSAGCLGSLILLICPLVVVLECKPRAPGSQGHPVPLHNIAPPVTPGNWTKDWVDFRSQSQSWACTTNKRWDSSVINSGRGGPRRPQLADPTGDRRQVLCAGLGEGRARARAQGCRRQTREWQVILVGVADVRGLQEDGAGPAGRSRLRVAKRFGSFLQGNEALRMFEQSYNLERTLCWPSTG